MPLVLPRSGFVQYVRHEEVLAEILGHDNFDGEDWVVGDRLIFEDGTESRIARESGSPAYRWEVRTPANFEEVKRAAGIGDAADWRELFAQFDEESERSSHDERLPTALDYDGGATRRRFPRWAIVAICILGAAIAFVVWFIVSWGFLRDGIRGRKP